MLKMNVEGKERIMDSKWKSYLNCGKLENVKREDNAVSIQLLLSGRFA